MRMLSPTFQYAQTVHPLLLRNNRYYPRYKDTRELQSFTCCVKVGNTLFVRIGLCEKAYSITTCRRFTDDAYMMALEYAMLTNYAMFPNTKRTQR